MPPKLTLEEAKKALDDVCLAFDEPTNAAKMEAAKSTAGGDMQKIMTMVVPVAMEIQRTVAERYGFGVDQPGMMQFMISINMHQSDPEIASKTASLKSRYMPAPKAT